MAEQQTAARPQGPGQGQGQGGQRRDSRPPRRDARRDAPREEKQFEENVINIDRVSRVVKGGRRFRFKALVVVGDKKNMITIPVVNSTIPHDAEVKLSGARVLIKPAAPGTGIIAGGVVRQVIGVTGISNMLSKSLGSTNKVNIAYATIEALQSLVPREEWIGAYRKAPKKVAKKAEAAKTEEKPAAAKKAEEK